MKSRHIESGARKESEKCHTFRVWRLVRVIVLLAFLACILLHYRTEPYRTETCTVSITVSYVQYRTVPVYTRRIMPYLPFFFCACRQPVNLSRALSVYEGLRTERVKTPDLYYSNVIVVPIEVIGTQMYSMIVGPFARPPTSCRNL